MWPGLASRLVEAESLSGRDAGATGTACVEPDGGGVCALLPVVAGVFSPSTPGLDPSSS